MFYPSSHPWVEGETLADHLEQRGVSRRDFVTFCAELGAVLGLGSALTPKLVKALQQT
jgi:hydrogenase small subunit